MSSISRRLLLWSAVMVAAVLSSAAAAGSSPGYCVPGQAIPLGPLPACRWYSASRACGGGGGVAPPLLLPVWHLKDACCRQLEAVPAECRCKALRAMAEEAPPEAVVGLGRACLLALARFAPAVVAEGECGLRTVHGIRFCLALTAED
ncbi:unnamed protein product [Urochloa humidicola]